MLTQKQVQTLVSRAVTIAQKQQSAIAVSVCGYTWRAFRFYANGRC